MKWNDGNKTTKNRLIKNSEKTENEGMLLHE